MTFIHPNTPFEFEGSAFWLWDWDAISIDNIASKGKRLGEQCLEKIPDVTSIYMQENAGWRFEQTIKK